VELGERDYRVFREIERWRFCLGRHIQFLAGFSSQRTCDRRLRRLLDEGFLTRHMVIYGVPNVYQLTNKAKALIFANRRPDKIRLEQIMHDVTVLDIAMCFIKAVRLSLSDIKTEKQLQQLGRFRKKNTSSGFCF